MAELLGNLGVIQREQGRYDEADASVNDSLADQDQLGDERRTAALAARAGTHRRGARRLSQGRRSLHGGALVAELEPELQWETRAGLAGPHEDRAASRTRTRSSARPSTPSNSRRAELRRAEHKISFFSSLYCFYHSYVDFLVTRGETGPRARSRRSQPGAPAARSRRRHPIAAQAAKPQQFRQLARALNATILFYWLAPERSFVWTITPADAKLRELPGPR